MAPFRFKLDALLEHRRELEETQQRRVAAIQGQINELVRQIRQTQEAVAEQNRLLKADHLLGRLNLSIITGEKHFVGNLQVLISTAIQKMAAAEKTLAGARVDLLAAARARKIIERLRDRQLARWREEQSRMEAASMDEIGTQLALRNLFEEEAAELELQPDF